MNLTSGEELEFQKFVTIPTCPRHVVIKHLFERLAFREAKNPDQIHRYVDGDHNEDEKVLHPRVRGDPIQGKGEGCFARCCRDNTEERNKDRVEIDGLYIFVANCVQVTAESETDDVGIDRDGYC